MLSIKSVRYFIPKSLPNALITVSKHEFNPQFSKIKNSFGTTCISLNNSGLIGAKANKSKVRKIIELVGVGFGMGALASGVYLYNNYRHINTTLYNESLDNHYLLQEPPPKHNIARSIRSPIDASGLKITLYQFQTCPFCCKVRAFLDYYGFSYDVVEVNSVTHKQTKWTSYRKVPFVVIEQPGTDTILQLKDSSMIISALQSFLLNKSQPLEDLVKGFPIVDYIDENGKKQKEIMNQYSIFYGEQHAGRSKEDILLERKWRMWTDKVYVHMLSPNVYRTMGESFQAFEWFSKVGDWENHFENWERLLVVYVGAFAMYFIGKRLKSRYHLKDDVRLSFYDETNILLRELKSRGGKFIGGKEPNLADLAVYGILMAVEGCDAFKDVLSNTQIEPWFARMKNVVDNKEGAKYLIERGHNKS